MCIHAYIYIYIRMMISQRDQSNGLQREGLNDIFEQSSKPSPQPHPLHEWQAKGIAARAGFSF